MSNNKKEKKLPLGHGIKKNKRKSTLQIREEIKRAINGTKVK